jgi:hypothetical protein
MGGAGKCLGGDCVVLTSLWDFLLFYFQNFALLHLPTYTCTCNHTETHMHTGILTRAHHSRTNKCTQKSVLCALQTCSCPCRQPPNPMHPLTSYAHTQSYTAVVGLDQWSRGQYPSASNQEDDVARIRNLVGTRPNTVNAPAGCTNFKLPYRDLTTVPSTTTTTYPQAAITCASGNHQYPVRIRGRYTITVSPVAESNLRFQVQIFTAVRRGGQWVTSGRGTTLGANDAYSSSSVVSAPRTIRTGNYIFRITAIAQATAPNTYAFPVYGSMGFYTVSIRNGF